jgi:hypothetical protein
MLENLSTLPNGAGYRKIFPMKQAVLAVPLAQFSTSFNVLLENGAVEAGRRKPDMCTSMKKLPRKDKLSVQCPHKAFLTAW